jgi:serine/threonine protein kinase
MSYCLNPNCVKTLNPDQNNFCQYCGASLLLRNRYRILKPLGKGGFGKTFLAQDTDRLNSSCVVKQFCPTQDIQADKTLMKKATELFNQEAERLFQLGEHPQIPSLLAYLEENKYLYLVQEFINGQTLLAELKEQGAFNEEKIRQLLGQILPVLDFIHQQGIIHRDIKPENIMRRKPTPSGFNKQGKNDLVLIDFGVAKQVTEFGTAGTTVGTPGYAPNEQLRGQVYPASDLYSLGVTCAVLLTEKIPKVNGSNQLYDALEDRWIWREKLPGNIKISENLGRILDKILQEKVKDRYQSSQQILLELVDNLTSAAGLNYRYLRDLLSAQNWTESQTETKRLMLKAVNRHPYGWLRLEDYQKFPVSELNNITELWSQYSNGKQEKLPLVLLQNITDDLTSNVGVDYTYLRNLLASGEWKDADAETVNVMLQAAKRTKEGFIDLPSIKSFPCADLLTINRLWVKYSNGNFGFSVQKNIWESVGGNNNPDDRTYKRFCDRIGWHNQGDLLYYSNLIYNITAPQGHLPSGRAGDINLMVRFLGKFGGFGKERIMAIVAKLTECGI